MVIFSLKPIRSSHFPHLFVISAEKLFQLMLLRDAPAPIAQHYPDLKFVYIGSGWITMDLLARLPITGTSRSSMEGLTRVRVFRQTKPLEILSIIGLIRC